MEWLWIIIILIVAVIGLFAAIRYMKSSNNTNKENGTVPTDYINKQDVLDVMQLLECLDEVYKME